MLLSNRCKDIGPGGVKCPCCIPWDPDRMKPGSRRVKRKFKKSQKRYEEKMWREEVWE